MEGDFVGVSGMGTKFGTAKCEPSRYSVGGVLSRTQAQDQMLIIVLLLR